MGFTLGVLSHYFGVSDPVIGILGCCSQVAASSLVAFSFVLGEWSLYVGKDFRQRQRCLRRTIESTPMDALASKEHACPFDGMATISTHRSLI